MIFVFGSNKQGIHGAGAAKFAVQNHGAIRGVGEGRQGNSYAIPTKQTPYITLPLEEIEKHVDKFLNYARSHPELVFEVTQIGCGLAGYKSEQVAPLFKDSPSNCVLTPLWKEICTKLI